MYKRQILDHLVQELRHGHGLDIIHTNRKQKKARNPGGGICVVFRKNLVQLKLYTFRKNGCELVACKGKFKQDGRSAIIIGAYIPPGLTKGRQDAYRDALHDLITKFKIEEKNPHIILAGDMNRCDLSECLSDFLDIEQLNTPPTRGDAHLEEIYTNLNTNINSCQTKPPLQNNEGSTSDHLTLLVRSSIPRRHNFDWIIYHARDMRKADRLGFMEEYAR